MRIASLDDLGITPADLDAARSFNRKLAYAPRFKVRSWFRVRLYQTVMRWGQIGADARVRRQGVALEKRWVGTGDHRVRARILRPNGPVRGVILDIHGGGWAVGNATLDDQFNVGFTRTSDVAAVSIDYRLFGKAPLEGLIDDCVAGARWLLDEPEFAGLPIILVGESAGGHLAAATLLRLKSEGRALDRFAGALLYYGVFDLTATPSVRRAGPDTLVLDGPNMPKAFARLTPGLSEAERRQPPLSPLYGDLAGFPPALMVVGELDPLLDDTLLMAERWCRAAEVELLRVPEGPHGFIRFPTPLADKTVARAQAWVNKRLASR